MKIILEVSDSEIILSMDEARKLYRELDSMFADKNTTVINRINEYRTYPYGRWYVDNIPYTTTLADASSEINCTTISLQGAIK